MSTHKLSERLAELNAKGEHPGAEEIEAAARLEDSQQQLIQYDCERFERFRSYCEHHSAPLGTDVYDFVMKDAIRFRSDLCTCRDVLRLPDGTCSECGKLVMKEK